jgi:predicted nucleotidyltransferase
MVSAEDLTLRLRRFFEGRGEVRLAFLFGSVSRGKSIPESDVDIGVWLKEGYDRSEVERLWAAVEQECGRNVDLVVLNEARPAIAWAAFRGRRLKIDSFRFFIGKMLEISDEAEFIQDFALELYALRRKWRDNS